MIEKILSRDNLRVRHGDYNNLKDVLDEVFRDFGHRTAVKYMKGNEVVTRTSDEFFGDIIETASELIRMGFYRKHIAIIGKNSYEWMVIYYAAMYSGCVSVPLSNALSAEEVEELCGYADVEAVFYGAELADTLQAARDASELRIYEMKSFMAGAYASDRVSEDGTIDNRTQKKDMVTIMFTSGSTGKSKGVMLTNENFRENFRCAVYHSHSALLILLLHHVATLTVANAFLGDAVELHIGDDPKQVVRYLSSMQSESTFVVPALLSVITARLKRVDYDISKLGWKLGHILCGGATFPSGVISRLNKTGILIDQYYGSTELCGGLLDGIMTEENPTTVGSELAVTMEATVIDGELCARGGRMFIGYYKDEESTNEVLYDGWYHTGDLARVDSEGNWYLTGRKKNLIILDNGENISPEEIETKLGLCTDIAEIIVYGEGSFLHAEILPAYDPESPEEDRQAMRDRITAFIDSYNSNAALYKRVPFTEFRDTPFEKNAAGKIVRPQR
jgi:long-chain acyl-CoA synthetase